MADAWDLVLHPAAFVEAAQHARTLQARIDQAYWGAVKACNRIEPIPGAEPALAVSPVLGKLANEAQDELGKVITRCDRLGD